MFFGGWILALFGDSSTCLVGPVEFRHIFIHQGVGFGAFDNHAGVGMLLVERYGEGAAVIDHEVEDFLFAGIEQSVYAVIQFLFAFESQRAVFRQSRVDDNELVAEMLSNVVFGVSERSRAKADIVCCLRMESGESGKKEAAKQCYCFF